MHSNDVRLPRGALMTLVACVIGLTVSVVPLFITGTATLLVPISSAMGWGRGDASMIIAVGLTSIAIGTAMVGRAIAIFGARPVIIFSTLAFALALAGFSFAPTLGWAIVLAALVGLFGTGASQFAYLNVLPLWFDRRLGLSFGIAMLGIGAGNALMPLAADWLNEVWGWRQAYWAMTAVVLFVAFPSAFFLLRVPEGDEHVPGAVVADYGVEASFAIRSRIFWQLALCFFLATTVIAGIGVHLPSLLQDRGYTPGEAAGAFSIFGISLLVARVLGGYLLDLIDGRWLGSGFLIGAGVGAALLASGLEGPAVFLCLVMLAMAHGVDGDLVPYLTRSYFGLRSYSTVYGLLGLAFGLGPVLGAIIMGYGFDHFGDYEPMLWATAIVTACAALLLATLPSPPVWQAEADTSRNGRPEEPEAVSLLR